jgi:antitoxin (DNA-binding transcriptional repressor) of toxin-antitoxin stability system
VSVQELEGDPLGTLNRVEAGETLLVIRDERPVAEIKPVARPTEQLRPFGLCMGEFVVPDDFDDPLPESLLSEFEGG